MFRSCIVSCGIGIQCNFFISGGNIPSRVAGHLLQRVIQSAILYIARGSNIDRLHLCFFARLLRSGARHWQRHSTFSWQVCNEPAFYNNTKKKKIKKKIHQENNRALGCLPLKTISPPTCTWLWSMLTFNSFRHTPPVLLLISTHPRSGWTSFSPQFDSLFF